MHCSITKNKKRQKKKNSCLFDNQPDKGAEKQDCLFKHQRAQTFRWHSVPQAKNKNKGGRNALYDLYECFVDHHFHDAWLQSSGQVVILLYGNKEKTLSLVVVEI